MDGHESHAMLEVRNVAEQRITVVSPPPRMSRTYNVEPLDVTFFGPLKARTVLKCTGLSVSTLDEK